MPPVFVYPARTHSSVSETFRSMSDCRGGWLCPRSRLRILIFFVPGHLNGFESFLVRFLGIILKFGKGDDPGMHVGETYGQRIRSRVGLN